MMRPDLPDRLKRAAEAFNRVAAMETKGETQVMACALVLSLHGPLFEEAREALREFADA